MALEDAQVAYQAMVATKAAPEHLDVIAAVGRIDAPFIRRFGAQVSEHNRVRRPDSPRGLWVDGDSCGSLDPPTIGPSITHEVPRPRRIGPCVESLLIGAEAVPA